MILANLIVFLVALYLLTWSIYLLTMPILSNLRIPDESPRRDPARSQTPQISVVIPAHDMEHCIERCIRSLLGSRYPGERFEVYIVADHCSDQTVAVARAAGAEVLIRDEEPAGKTFALDWAFRQLNTRGVSSDLYVIVDATAYVADDFLSSLAERSSSGENVIMAHTLVDPTNQKWFARCLGLTLAHRNLQDAARERLALSALVCGRGMAFGKEYIEKHGWRLALPSESSAGNHPTEDFRHGVRLAEHGYRVAFAADAHVYTPLRQSLGAATRQNVRWERGRIGNAYTHARELLSQAIRERQLRKLIAAVDAIQPPVAVVIGLSGGLAFLAVLFTDTSSMLFVTLLPFLLVFMYSVLVIRQGQQEGIKLTALLWAPIYIGWRVSAFLAALTGLDRLLDRKTKRTTSLM
jgi:cellulose synthase/poly-beta-1,6-N-acetylglucosamine synthase-like glycosyltransferase